MMCVSEHEGLLSTANDVERWYNSADVRKVAEAKKKDNTTVVVE